MGRWTRNADVVERLSSDLQERYEFSFAWESVCAMYQALPGLRGFWPMSSISNTQAQDLSGQGRHLTWNGSTPHFGYDVLIPYFDAVDNPLPLFPDYLSRGDEPGLDIIGNEGYVEAASQGITMGAWIRFDTAAPANADMIISKGQFLVPGNTSYGLYRRAAAAGGTLRATFSNGVVFEHIDSVATLATSTWYFTAAKWSPATGLDESACFLNRTKAQVTPTTLVGPATLLNTGSPLQIMGRDNGVASTENTSGRVSMAFLCCQALHDGAIIALFERSRALFGV